MAGYDRDRPFIQPVPPPQHPRRQPIFGSRPPPQPQPQLRSRVNPRLDNGSTLCAAFLVKGYCPRDECNWDHRKPRLGERVPLCAHELLNGPCRKQICPLDHTPQPKQDLPRNKPPLSVPTAQRGNSDPESLARMEQQRSEMSGVSGPPQMSEAGTGISRRLPPKDLASSKPFGDCTALAAPANNRPENMRTSSQTNNLRDANLGQAKIIEKIEALKKTDWPRKVNIPKPAEVNGHHRQSHINPGFTKKPQQNGLDESNLLLDEVEEDKTQNTIKTRAANPSFSPDHSNYQLMDMLGNDGVQCSSAILQQTTESIGQSIEMKELRDSFGNGARNASGDYSKNSNFVLRQRDDVPTVGRVCGDGFDGVCGSQYGLLPPGMPMRGTELAAAPGRKVQIPRAKEVSAFGDVPAGNVIPLRFPERDSHSRKSNDHVLVPDLGRNVKIPTGPKSHRVGNLGAGMDETRERGMYNNLERRFSNGLEDIPLASNLSKSQPILPQDLVGQVLSTCPAQTNVKTESPSNNGQIYFPSVSPPETLLNPQNFSVPLHTRNPPQIQQPTPLRGPSFSQVASLQDKSLSFYPNLSQSLAKQTETKTPSFYTPKTHMEKNPNVGSSSKNNQKPPDKMMAEKDNMSKLDPTSYSINGNGLIDNSTTLDQSRENNKSPTGEGSQDEDPDYNWEFVRPRMPTCGKCYYYGHHSRNCTLNRPMPLDFLQVEARQDGVKVKLLEGNWPSYRLHPEKPLDKAYREKLLRKANGTQSPMDSSEDEASSAVEYIGGRSRSQEAVWHPNLVLSHPDENTNPPTSAVEELQQYIDKTSYMDIRDSSGVYPFEWHLKLVDKCFKNLEIQEEGKGFRGERAPALAAYKDEGYRACGVRLIQPPPQPKAESVSTSTSTASEAEALEEPVPEQPKVAIVHKERPELRSDTRNPSAGPSSQDKQSPPTGPRKVASPAVVASQSENVDEESAKYVLKRRVCYNCWDDDHVTFDCRLPPKMFHIRETLRREKKVWSFSWAQLLYHKHQEFMLFVPSQYKAEFEEWKAARRVKENADYNEKLFGSEVPATFSGINTSGGKPDSISTSSQPRTPDNVQQTLLSRPTTATSPAQCASPISRSDSKRAEVATSTLKAEEDVGHKVVLYKGSRAPSRTAVRHWDAACWNCWSSDLHFVKTCPERRRTDRERELLRRKKMVFSRRWNEHMHAFNRDAELLPLSEMVTWFETYHANPPLDSRSSSPESPKGHAVSPRTPPGNYHSAIISAENPCWQCRGVHEQFNCPRDPPGLRNGAPEIKKPAAGYKGKERAMIVPDSVASQPRSPSFDYDSSSSSGRSKTPKYSHDAIETFQSSLWVASSHAITQRYSTSFDLRSGIPGKKVDICDTYPPSYYREQAARKAAREKKFSKPFTGRALFPELPNEILNNIFLRLWDKGVVRDNFTGDSDEHIAMAKRIQCREYRGLLRVNKRCCAVAQRLIYTNMTIIDRHAMIRFMRTLSSENSPQLRQYVQHIKFAIVPVVNSQAQFRFNSSKRRNVALDEIEAKRFNGPDVDENLMYYKSVRIVPFLMKQCPNLQTLVAQFRGSIVGFEKVPSNQEYEQLRELTLNDKDCTAVCLRNLWRVAQACPSLKQLTLEYGRENRFVDFAPIAIRSSLATYKNGFYRNLTFLSFNLAPEISDEWMVIFASRMPKLQKIHLEDCKNVSADGVAKCLKNLNMPLLELTYICYMDWSGRVTEIEANSGSAGHLCEALGAHSETLEKLDLRPYRICKRLFEDRQWTNIKTFLVDMMAYRGCIGPDGEMEFHEVQSASKTCKVPSPALKKFHLNLSGSACVRTRRAGEPDLPPITSADYRNNNHY